MKLDYAIPAQGVSFEETIKKSRFITLLAHAADRQQANAFVANTRQQHPEARHHCWAFVAGAPTDSQCLGFSDDGEPSGTAGKPILAQLQGSGVGEIVAVVVRYSGGIKLGTGGLVKAYGGGAQQALKLLETETKVAMERVTLTFDYSHSGTVERMLELHQGEKLASDFGNQAVFEIQVPCANVAGFEQQLVDASKGAITIKREQP